MLVLSSILSDAALLREPIQPLRERSIRWSRHINMFQGEEQKVKG